MLNTASTIRGTATIDPNVALADLNVGDLVLGMPTPDIAPLRTLYRVVKPYGRHQCPLESPSSRLDRLTARLFDGRRLGVLVEMVGAEEAKGEPPPAMFAEESTPALDRVTALP